MKRNFSFLILTIVFVIGMESCKDNEDCYDAAMEENHTGLCTQDCPQVCGCDGITYCNECIAASKGISVVYSGPCR